MAHLDVSVFASLVCPLTPHAAHVLPEVVWPPHPPLLFSAFLAAVLYRTANRPKSQSQVLPVWASIRL